MAFGSTYEPQVTVLDVVRDVLQRNAYLGNPYLDIPDRSRRFGEEFARSHHFEEFVRPRRFGAEFARDSKMRLFHTDVGMTSYHIVGNEAKTLELLGSLSVDIMLETARTSAARRLGSTFRLHEDMRRLYVPAQGGFPPTLLILDPETPFSDTRLITDELAVVPEMLALTLEGTPSGDEEEVRRVVFSAPNHIFTTLNITQPEVILTSRPRMERLSVPSRMVPVRNSKERSTAGILCTDRSGQLGITACFHGTGPEKTDVTVDGLPAQVTLANEVQDLVFIPLPEGLELTKMSPLHRVRTKPPGVSPASFNGLTSGLRFTHINSTDAGLERRRASLQLKVQTPADTDRGDSGAALVDEENFIVGFAFEKSAYGEFPQITDWIWAANALNALDLTPY